MPKGIPNKRYTPEFKRLVVETMREEDLSVREAMRRFEINDHGIIERWERIYLEEGVTLGADFDADVLLGRAGFDDVTAGTSDGGLFVSGMDALFHCVSPLSRSG